MICPESSEHHYETVLADDTRFRPIADLSDELSMGVRFLDREATWRNEVHSAAASFLGNAPPMELWQEAFADSPHAPLHELFPVHGLRVTIEPEKIDWLEEEAADDKRQALLFQQAWNTARAAGVTFDKQVENEFAAMLGWKLFPLVNQNGYSTWLADSHREMSRELANGQDVGRTGSAYNRYLHRRALGEFSRYLLNRYTGLRGREREFLESEQLRCAPSLRYPPLFLAALCCTPRRKAKPGDLYDIYHLTQGFSRCDIVTADASMAQLCRDFRLIPSTVRLFSARELDDLAEHVGTAL